MPRGFYVWFAIVVAFAAAAALGPVLADEEFTLFGFKMGLLKADLAWLRDIGFFLAGAGIAPLGLWLANRRTENDAARRITDAFTKAVELLGHENVAVRLGGIYALGRLARETKSEHPKIMDIVAAYIRQGSKDYAKMLVAKAAGVEWDKKEGAKMLDDDLLAAPGDLENVVAKIENMPIDLEAAIAVIRERDVASDKKLGADGFLFDLSNSYMKNVDFSNTSLRRVNLSDCQIHGGIFTKTDLSGAIMVKSNFAGSDFAKACFRDAQMKGVILDDADLAQAKGLTQAQIDSTTSGGGTMLPPSIKEPDDWEHGRTSTSRLI